MTLDNILDYQKKILLKEIDIVQRKIMQYDMLSFQIKGWAVTLWAGIILWGLNFYSSGIFIIIVSLIELSIFWSLDTIFKVYQRYHIVRYEVIQDFINSKNYYKKNGLKERLENQDFGDFIFYDLNSRLGNKYVSNIKKEIRKKTNIIRCAFVRSIWIPYYFLMCAGGLIGLYLEEVTFNILILYGIASTIVFLIICALWFVIHRTLFKE